MRKGTASSSEKTDLPHTPKPDATELIPGPKLRAKLGISAVSLWRWRHDEMSGFPAPKVINGRLYFPLDAVTAWLAARCCEQWGVSACSCPAITGADQARVHFRRLG